jgi:hypothetical protein
MNIACICGNIIVNPFNLYNLYVLIKKSKNGKRYTMQTMRTGHIYIRQKLIRQKYYKKKRHILYNDRKIHKEDITVIHIHTTNNPKTHKIKTHGTDGRNRQFNKNS